MIIGLVSAAAGAATLANFSDSESSTGNTFAAGTLDLTGTGQDGAMATFSVSNIAPSDSGDRSITLQNDGTIAGDLAVNVTDVANDGGAHTEPETEAGDSGNSGHLGANLEVALWIDRDGTGDVSDGDIGLNANGNQYAVSAASDLQYDPVNDYEMQEWNNVDTLGDSESSVFNVEYTLPGTTGNIVQGDSSTMDFRFDLEQ